jgi:hypothetical protein
LFIAVIILTGVSGCAELWAVHTYGSLDPLIVPTKLNVFGRDYRAGDSGPSTREQVLATRGGDPVDILEPAIGAWPFVPPWVGSVTGYATPTTVWLHVGPDAYQRFGLVGGP